MNAESNIDAPLQAAWEARVAIRETPIEARVARVEACAAILQDNRERLIDLAISTAGCIRKWAVAQVDSSIRICRNIGQRAKKLQPELIDLPYTQDSASLLREPQGVIGLVTPSNSPYRSMMVGVTEAMAAGSPVVVKPSTVSLKAVAEVLNLIGDKLGPSVQLMSVPGHEAARILTSDQRVSVVRLYGNFKTGVAYLNAYTEALNQSVKVGSPLGKRRLKSFLLELSGNDPLVVLPGANVAEAVSATVQGSFLNSGQVCLCAKRIVVHRDVVDEFVPQLVEGVRSLKIGDPNDPETDIGPLMKPSHADLLMKILEDARAKSGEVLCGGTYENQVLAPTVVRFDKAVVSQSGAKRPIVWGEESFGPVRPLVVVDDLDEAHAHAGDTSYGLGATIFGAPEASLKLARRLDAGRVVINTNPAAHVGQFLPFGGTKDSGLRGANYAIRELTYGKLLIQG